MVKVLWPQYWNVFWFDVIVVIFSKPWTVEVFELAQENVVGSFNEAIDPYRVSCFYFVFDVLVSAKHGYTVVFEV